MQLIFLEDSCLKAVPEQSTELEDNGLEHQLIWVKIGQKFEISHHYPVQTDHVGVQLAPPPSPPDGAWVQRRWVVFSEHIEILGNLPNNQPNDEPTKYESSVIPFFDKGVMMDLPGLGRRGTLEKITRHFNWHEATKGGSRIPETAQVVRNIVSMAKTMEEVRTVLGNRPIRVNSWYRDPITNRRVGGASRSRHLSGDAVDFVVSKMSPKEVYEELDGWWGSRGGLAAANTFTHIDARGYRSRWDY